MYDIHNLELLEQEEYVLLEERLSIVDTMLEKHHKILEQLCKDSLSSGMLTRAIKDLGDAHDALLKELMSRGYYLN